MANDLRERKTLVIGACGYLGWRVVKWLLDESGVPASHINVIDAVKPLAEREAPGVKYHQADLTHQKSVKDIFASFKPDIVIHTASPPYHLGHLDTFLRVNVEGTRTLLDLAVEQSSVQVFVYTSSSSVVHNFVSDLVEADESYPLLFMPQQPQPYHHSKALAEQLVIKDNRRRPNFVVAAIRPSAMFGPGEGVIIPNMVQRAKTGSLRYQIGDGTNRADFTYVDNTVYGHILAVEALLKVVRESPKALPEDMRVEGEAFTITNDEHPKFWEFSRSIGAAAGYPIDSNRVVSIPAIIGLSVASIIEWLVWLASFGRKTAKVKRMDLHYSTITRTFDISKAKKRLGYRPRVSLDQGVELAVASPVGEKKDT